MATALDNPRWTRLSAERQAELLTEYRDVNVDHEWWEYTYEWFRERCRDLGIEVGGMNFSGFWSQGDGASFSGYVDDWKVVLTAIGETHLLDLAKEMDWAYKVNNSRGMYSHSNSMRGELHAEVPTNPYDEEDEPLQHDAWNIVKDLPPEMELDKLEVTLTEYCRSLADDLYKALEDEYEWLTDDQAIVDWMLENLEDGELRDPNEDLLEPDEEDNAERQLELELS